MVTADHAQQRQDRHSGSRSGPASGPLGRSQCHPEVCRWHRRNDPSDRDRTRHSFKARAAPIVPLNALIVPTSCAATSATGRPLSTRSSTLRRNSTRYLPGTTTSSWVDEPEIQLHLAARSSGQTTTKPRAVRCQPGTGATVAQEPGPRPKNVTQLPEPQCPP